jgi:uncharacterized protein DUF4158
VPSAAVDYIARQVGVDPAAYGQYDWRSRASTTHRSQIRDYCQFREARSENLPDLKAWLCAHVIATAPRPDLLKTRIYTRLRDLRIEPPRPAQIDKLIASALRTYETQLYATILDQLGAAGLTALDSLLGPARRPLPSPFSAPAAAPTLGRPAPPDGDDALLSHAPVLQAAQPRHSVADGP